MKVEMLSWLHYLQPHLEKKYGSLHMKTDQDIIIIHVEYTVVEEGVHHVPNEVLDFGTLIERGVYSSRSLSLLNAGSSTVRIEKIAISDEEPSFNLTMQSRIIPPKTVCLSFEFDICLYYYGHGTT